MARSIWSGSISFGLVNVPCKLYSATSPKTVRFHQLNSATGARVAQKRVDAASGEEVPFEEIVKGYELSSDRYVIVLPQELDALSPKKTKMIELESFADLEQIDPIAYDKSYYVAPDGIAAGRPYRLLAEAMRKSGRVGIGRFVLRSKESLVALRANEHGTLVASTLLFGDEVIDDLKVVEMPDDAPEPSEAEVNMAGALIESLAEEFEHGRYEDTYRAKVLDLIERKAAGETIEAPAPVESSAPPADLMAALTASLATTPAKKPAAKKPPPKAPARRSKKVAA